MCTVPFPFQKIKKGKDWFFWGVVIFLTFFCRSLTIAQTQQNSPVDSIAESLAQQLTSNLFSPSSQPPRTLMVNIVDVGQLHCTSKFGQIIPERLGTFLQQRGWKIVEARRGHTVKLQEDVGRFNLSDNVKDLAKRVNCQAILAGTYLFHMGKIMVNMRLIRISDNEIISTASAQEEAGPWISTLLRPIGIGCRSPKSFLKITPWNSEETVKDETRYSSKEEPIDDYAY